ncbi:MAG: AMP-binding protein, partial [Dehalococcoidia bacterium]|nr:AMP-binding protein [Dehalococcoidia bacterium]
MVTLANLLDGHQPEKASITIPNGPTVSYGEFGNEVERVAGLLAASGLKKGRAVSIVLGNGLDFMVIFLAVTRSGAIAAPLNAAYTVEEFKFFMEDADAQLVIVSKEADAALTAAADLSVPCAVAELDEKGHVTINKNGSELTESVDAVPPSPNDIALFLHTSGTTSRPKGVPLTHANLMASLGNIVSTYELTEEDTALVVMPLFHVHGLIGVSLSSLRSGGT